MATQHLFRNVALFLPKNVSGIAVTLSAKRGFAFNRHATGRLMSSVCSTGRGIYANSLEISTRNNTSAGLSSFYSTSPNPEDSSVDLSFDDLQALIKSGDIQLIDVREPKELIEYGQYPGAINIPLGQLKEALSMSTDQFLKTFNALAKPKPEDSNVVFCCLLGIRSRKAIGVANEVGFTKTRHYKGGWDDYHKHMNLPLKKNPTSG